MRTFYITPARRFRIRVTEVRINKPRSAGTGTSGRQLSARMFQMWTREIDARIARLIADLEIGLGVKFPKLPWLE